MKYFSFYAYIWIAIVTSASSALAEPFVVPFDAQLFIRPIGGEASGSTEFGIARSATDLLPLFSGLPNNPQPNTEVSIGLFSKGDQVNFYEKTLFGGQLSEAFSFDTSTAASRVAFSDVDNSLGFGHRVIEQVDASTWLMHLDDAASFQIDDDDNDVLAQIRVIHAVVPEPSAIALLALGLAGVAFWRRKSTTSQAGA